MTLQLVINSSNKSQTSKKIHGSRARSQRKQFTLKAQVILPTKSSIIHHLKAVTQCSLAKQVSRLLQAAWTRPSLPLNCKWSTVRAHFSMKTTWITKKTKMLATKQFVIHRDVLQLQLLTKFNSRSNTTSMLTTEWSGWPFLSIALLTTESKSISKSNSSQGVQLAYRNQNHSTHLSPWNGPTQLMRMMLRYQILAMLSSRMPLRTRVMILLQTQVMILLRILVIRTQIKDQVTASKLQTLQLKLTKWSSK